MRPDWNPERSIPARGLELSPRRFSGLLRAGAQCSPGGPFGAPLPAGAGTGRGRGGALTWRSRRFRGRGRLQPRRGPPLRILRSGAPGLQDLRPGSGPASPPAPSEAPCGRRGDRRGAGHRSAQKRERARRRVPPLSPAPVRPPPASRRRRLLSSQRRWIRFSRQEGSQRSASGASGEDGNSAAPARRPAPGLGPAPRWWRPRRWPGREGISPQSPLPSWELTGAAPTRALRLPRPHGRRSWEGDAAGRGPAAPGVGVGVGMPRAAPVSQPPPEPDSGRPLGSRPRPERCLCLAGSHAGADPGRGQGVTRAGRDRSWAGGRA